MAELVTTLQRLGNDLSTLFLQLAALLAPLWPVLLWVAWWLWGVNWQKLWPTLRQGAWAPLVLVVLMIAGVWAALAPEPYPVSDHWALAAFWWHLAAVGMLVATAFFCGWLQGVVHWVPREVPIEAVAAAHDHGHGHDDHGHDHEEHGHGAHH